MAAKKSKKPPRTRYFYLTIDIQAMLETVLFKGVMAHLFDVIARKGAHVVSSIELNETEYKQMMNQREKMIKESKDAEEKAKKAAAIITQAQEDKNNGNNLNKENAEDTCPDCKGFGEIPGPVCPNFEVCPTCKGSGKKNNGNS